MQATSAVGQAREIGSHTQQGTVLAAERHMLLHGQAPAPESPSTTGHCWECREHEPSLTARRGYGWSYICLQKRSRTHSAPLPQTRGHHGSRLTGGPGSRCPPPRAVFKGARLIPLDKGQARALPTHWGHRQVGGRDVETPARPRRGVRKGCGGQAGTDRHGQALIVSPARDALFVILGENSERVPTSLPTSLRIRSCDNFEQCF